MPRPSKIESNDNFISEIKPRIHTNDTKKINPFILDG